MKASEPVAQYTTFEEMLEKDGYIVYSNVGYSMMPLLRQRKDIIEIRKKGPGRCKKYDVVLYKRGNKYIAQDSGSASGRLYHCRGPQHFSGDGH